MPDWEEIISRLDKEELDALNNPRLDEQGNPIYTTWIYIVSNVDLRRAELDMRHPELNSTSIQVYSPLIIKEMARRGLKKYLNSDDEEFFNQLGDILSGNIE